jgi:GTP-binding protein
MAEKLSVVMARKNIEDADIVLFMVDATEGASGLDANIAGYAHESGRSVIILVNKWDLVASGEKRAISQSRTARIQDAKRPQDRALYEERLRYGLKFLSLCSGAISFGAHRQGDGKDSSADRESGG